MRAPSHFRPNSRSTFLTIVAALWGAVASPGATAPAPKGPPAPKTHTLYMGADIAVERGGELYRVQDVQGDSFVIVVKGERVLVPMRANPVTLKINESLKVTRKSATIEKLRGERAYTPGADPHRKFAREVGIAAGAAADVDLAAATLAGAQSGLQAAQQLQGANPGGDFSGQIAAAERNVANATQRLDSMSSFASSNLANPGYYAGLLQAELEKKLFDALEVSFEISAASPLENPYVVIVARYREQEGKPGTARNWIYAQALDTVDAKPRKVYVLRGGFPPGFDMEHYQVHLYDRGAEIATNVSRKRVPLTTEEAFQYSVIEYVARHKGTTLRARALPPELSGDLRTRLPADGFDRTHFVKVGKDGKPSAVFLDEQCTRQLGDAELAAAFLALRFHPALDKGKPVEGVAEVNLGELTK